MPFSWVVDGEGESDLLLPETLKRFSASGLSKYMTCPEQWRQKYVLKTPSPGNFDLALGSAFHFAAGFNFEQKIVSHEDVPQHALIEFLHDEAVPQALEKQQEYGPLNWKGKTKDDLHRDGEECAIAYHKNVAPRVQPIEVEREVLVDVGLALPLYGFIDVETENVVIDLKTSGSKVSKPKGSWWLQGDVYSLMTGGKPVHWHVLVKNKTRKDTYTPLEEPGLLQKSDAAKTMLQMKAIQAGIDWNMRTFGPDQPWLPVGKEHDKCGYCDFRSVCAWQ